MIKKLIFIIFLIIIILYPLNISKNVFSQDEEIIFSDDFENGLSKWRVVKEDGVDRWSISTERYYSPTHSLKNTQNPLYGSFANTTVTSKQINIENYVSLRIEFYYWSLFEGYYDKVEFFANGIDNGKIINYEFEQSTNANWKKLSLDLSPILKGNKNLTVSFKFTSDVIGTATGFYVDDIKIYGIKGQVEIKTPTYKILEIVPSEINRNFNPGNRISIKLKFQYSDGSNISNKEVIVYDPTSNNIIRSTTDKDGNLNYQSQANVYVEGIYEFLFIIENQKFYINVPVVFFNKNYLSPYNISNFDFSKIKIVNEKEEGYKFNFNDYIDTISIIFDIITSNIKNINSFIYFTSPLLNSNFEINYKLYISTYQFNPDNNIKTATINAINKSYLNSSIKSKYINLINNNSVYYILFSLPQKNEQVTYNNMINKINSILNNIIGSYNIINNNNFILSIYDSKSCVSIILLQKSYPNLKIKDVNLLSNKIKTDETLKFSVEIENNGDSVAENFDLTIFLDNNKYREELISRLDPNSTIILNFEISNLNQGNHFLRVIVDNKNSINESNEEDNQVIKYFDVISLPSPPRILKIEQLNDGILIKWEKSNKGSFDIKGYEIYRDNELLTKIEDPNISEYLDKNVNKGYRYCYKIRAYDIYSNYSQFSDLYCVDVKKREPPNLSLNLYPEKTYEKVVTLSGKVENTVYLYINNNLVEIKSDNTFTYLVKLNEGLNEIIFRLIGYDDQTIEKKIYIEYVKEIVIVLQINNKIILVQNNPMEIDVAPMIIEGRTYLPIRWILEPLGANLYWDPNEKKITIIFKEIVIELWIGKNFAKVNGVIKMIDSNNPKVTPLIIQGRTMLPLRFVAENLGCTVLWDSATKSITVIYRP